MRYSKNLNDTILFSIQHREWETVHKNSSYIRFPLYRISLWSLAHTLHHVFEFRQISCAKSWLL